MTPLVARFIKDKSGTTAIEYGLIGVGISIAILVAVQLLGSNVWASEHSRRRPRRRALTKRYVPSHPPF